MYNTQHAAQHQCSHHTHEKHNSSTAHQFSCCIHRLKRSRASPHSPCPQPGTLIVAPGRDDAVGVSHRQKLSASSSWQFVYSCTAVIAVSLSWTLPNKRAAPMLSTRPARSASGCRRRSLGVETASATCARRDGTCWAMVAVARF